MATIVDKILGRAGKAAPTSAEIRQEVSHAEAAVEAARRALVDAQAGYRATLLGEDPAATTTAKAAIIAAEVDIDRAEALVAALRERFLEACEREAEDERRANYAAARRAHEFGVKRLREYAAHAAAIADIVADIAETERQIAAANEDLPDDTAPVPSVEATVRYTAALPERIVEVKLEDAGWFYSPYGPPEISDSPVEADLVRDIRQRSVNLGTLERNRSPHRGRETLVVVRRKRRVTRFLTPAPATLVAPIAFEIRLPGLRHFDPPFWSAPAWMPLYLSNPAASSVALVEHAQGCAAARDVEPDNPQHQWQLPDTRREFAVDHALLEEAERLAAELGLTR